MLQSLDNTMITEMDQIPVPNQESDHPINSPPHIGIIFAELIDTLFQSHPLPRSDDLQIDASEHNSQRNRSNQQLMEIELLRNSPFFSPPNDQKSEQDNAIL